MMGNYAHKLFKCLLCFEYYAIVSSIEFILDILFSSYVLSICLNFIDWNLLSSIHFFS